MALITGETVTVLYPSRELDGLMEPLDGEPRRVPLPNVLVAPGSCADLDATRPEGASVSFTLHMPKGTPADLAGASVVVRGETYKVVGDPQRYDPANTPGPWDMAVEVGRTDG